MCLLWRLVPWRRSNPQKLPRYPIHSVTYWSTGKDSGIFLTCLNIIFFGGFSLYMWPVWFCVMWPWLGILPMSAKCGRSELWQMQGQSMNRKPEVSQKSLYVHLNFQWWTNPSNIFFQPDTYGFDSCAGCRDCNCGLASVSTQCDSITGQCTCMPGTEGNYCDQCSEGFWNYTAAGCQGNHLENQESEAKRCFTEWEMNTETYTCLILITVH